MPQLKKVKTEKRSFEEIQAERREKDRIRKEKLRQDPDKAAAERERNRVSTRLRRTQLRNYGHDGVGCAPYYSIGESDQDYEEDEFSVSPRFRSPEDIKAARREKDRIRKRELRQNLGRAEAEKEKNRLRARERRAKLKQERSGVYVPSDSGASKDYNEGNENESIEIENTKTKTLSSPQETRQHRLEKERIRMRAVRARKRACETTAHEIRSKEALRKRIQRDIDKKLLTSDEKVMQKEVDSYRHRFIKKKNRKEVKGKGKPLPLTLRDEEEAAFMEVTLHLVRVEVEDERKKLCDEAFLIEIGKTGPEPSNGESETAPTTQISADVVGPTTENYKDLPPDDNQFIPLIVHKEELPESDEEERYANLSLLCSSVQVKLEPEDMDQDQNQINEEVWTPPESRDDDNDSDYSNSGPRPKRGSNNRSNSTQAMTKSKSLSKLEELKRHFEKIRLCWVNLNPNLEDIETLDQTRNALVKKIREDKSSLCTKVREELQILREKGEALFSKKAAEAVEGAGEATTSHDKAPKKRIRKKLTNVESIQARNLAMKVRKGMEKSEYEVYNALETILNTAEPETDKMTKFEAFFQNDEYQKTIQYWGSYRAGIKVKPEVVQWRGILATIAEKRKITSNLPTPFQMLTDISTAKQFITQNGSIVKEHVTFKRFYIYNAQKERIERRKATWTPEQLAAYNKKVNDYLRMKYWRKKGVNIEPGEYFNVNISEGMFNKKMGIVKEKVRTRRVRKRKDPSSITDKVPRKRGPNKSSESKQRKPRQNKKHKTGMDNFASYSSQIGHQYRRTTDYSNSGGGYSHTPNKDDDEDGWVPFDVDNLINNVATEQQHGYHGGQNHQHQSFQFLQNQQGTAHPHSGYQHIHSPQRSFQLQLVNTSVAQAPWNNQNQGEPYSLQFLPNSQINMIGTNYQQNGVIPNNQNSVYHHSHEGGSSISDSYCGDQYADEHDNDDDDDSYTPHTTSRRSRGRPRGSKNSGTPSRRRLNKLSNSTASGICRKYASKRPGGRKSASLVNLQLSALTELASPLDKLKGLDPTIAISTGVTSSSLLLPKCVKCNKVFEDETFLQKHVKRWHPPGKDNDDGIHDMETEATTSEPRETVVNTEAVDGLQDVETTVTASISKPKSSALTCTICDIKFSSTRSLITHISDVHYGSKVYTCPIGIRAGLACARNLVSRKFLKEHMARKHPKEYAEMWVMGINSKFERKKKTESECKKYLCLYCDQDFSGMAQITEHYKEVHSRVRYQCEFCGILLQEEDHWKDHVALFHPENTPEVGKSPKIEIQKEHIFMCECCHSHFISDDFLDFHLEQGHTYRSPWADTHSPSKNNNTFGDEDLEEESETQNPYKCEICKNSFATLCALRFHGIKDHGLMDYVKRGKEMGFYKEKQVDEQVAKPLPQIAPPRIYKTQNQHNSTPQQRRPRKGKEDTNSISCPVCLLGFTSAEFHEQHIRYDKLLRRYCTPCARLFPRAYFFNKHNEKAHGIYQDNPKAYSATPTATNAGRQLPASSSSSGQIACPKCCCSFSAQMFHDHHSLFKSDERICEICSETFQYADHYRKHMRSVHGNGEEIRTQEKRELQPQDYDNLTVTTQLSQMTIYTCKVCRKNYKTVDFVRTHIAERHKDDAFTRLICTPCDATFVDKASLRAHMKYNHGEQKKIVCPFCKKLFSTRMKGFRHHIKVVHKGRSYKPEDIKIVTGDNSVGENEVVCKLCCRNFANEDRLKYHMTTVHFPIHFTTFCEFCGQQLNPSYRRKHNLRNHRDLVDCGKEEDDPSVPIEQGQVRKNIPHTSRPTLQKKNEGIIFVQLVELMHEIISMDDDKAEESSKPKKTRKRKRSKSVKSSLQRNRKRKNAESESLDDEDELNSDDSISDENEITIAQFLCGEEDFYHEAEEDDPESDTNVKLKDFIFVPKSETATTKNVKRRCSNRTKAVAKSSKVYSDSDVNSESSDDDSDFTPTTSREKRRFSESKKGNSSSSTSRIRTRSSIPNSDGDRT